MVNIHPWTTPQPPYRRTDPPPAGAPAMTSAIVHNIEQSRFEMNVAAPDARRPLLALAEYSLDDESRTQVATAQQAHPSATQAYRPNSQCVAICQGSGGETKRRRRTVLDLFHTSTPPACRGQGIAGKVSGGNRPSGVHALASA